LRVCRILSALRAMAEASILPCSIAHATRVEIRLFDEQGERETARVVPEYADEIWHGYLRGVAPGAFNAVVPLLGTHLRALIQSTSLSPSSSL
jgi:hypothetical protein